MTERIVLLTIRREYETRVDLLVNGRENAWTPVSMDVASGELPVETAVRAGEDLFGPQSFCPIWLLGRTTESGMTSYFYCLDIDAVAVSTPLPAGYTWIALDQAGASFTGAAKALFEKLNAYREKTVR